MVVLVSWVCFTFYVAEIHKQDTQLLQLTDGSRACLEEKRGEKLTDGHKRAQKNDSH